MNIIISAAISLHGVSRIVRDASLKVALCAVLMAAAGCEKASPPPSSTTTTASSPAPVPNENAAVAPALPESAPLSQPSAPPPPPPPVVIPAGTRIVVRLDTTLASNTSTVGETFSGTVAKPVRVKGTDVIASQAAVVGTVVDAKAAGKFAGASSLGLRLQSVADHSVATTAYSQHVEGKGKRTAAVIGGTALAGALLGGLAGHGRGALIGAAAGGGVGTLGAAETGNNRDIVLPAGSVLTFNLTQSLTVNPPRP